VSTKTPFIPHFHGGALGDGIFKGELPDCLSDDALNALMEAVSKDELPEHVLDDALYARAGGIFQGELPDWPSDDVLNDGKRFYMVRCPIYIMTQQHCIKFFFWVCVCVC